MTVVLGSDAFVPGERIAVPSTGRGALTGLRFAVADTIDLAGHPTGAGNHDWLAHATPAARHASAVERLLAAGAACAGKTVTGELAGGLAGDNAHYGIPTNPANPDWLPGGASSGSAVATASGAVDFALGIDTGGSVRVPAALCRIFGFRPSHGAVGLAGALPLAPSYDTVGWFARDAATLEAVGRALLPPGSTVPIRRVRLASDVLARVDPDLARDIVDAARGVVTDSPIDLLGGHSLAELRDAFAVVEGYEITQALGARLATVQPRLGPAIAARLAEARRITDSDYREALDRRTRFAAHIAAHCPSDTAIVMPLVSVHHLPRSASPADIAAFNAATSGLAAIAGHPGMPQLQLARVAGRAGIGCALLAARGADRALLRLATGLSEREHRVA